MMCMVLKRVEIENIIGHCLIVLRGNTQEKTEYEFIIRGGWEGRDESEKEGTYQTQYKHKKIEKDPKQQNAQPVQKS